MWQYGSVTWQGEELEWGAKVHDSPVIWGIDDGRVSELYISPFDERGLLFYEYDRDWCGEEPPQELIDMIVSLFPVREEE